MVKFHTFFLLIIVTFYSKAQNEFYNNGAVVYVNDKINTSTATLRVNGEIINNNGSFTNYQSLIELTGNWTNTSSTNYYVSTGIERFLGTTDQTIDGTWNGTASNRNQFYDLKVKKTATSGQNVNLNVNTNVNSNGSLEFESTNGIIRSDVSSHTNNGSLYPYELFLRNSDPTKLISSSWPTVLQFDNTGGATTKYIEGKLRRAVSSNNTYNFPIGVAPASLDGMEGVSVSFTGTFTTTDVLAYIQPAATPTYTSDIITNGGILFYDIGSLPATSPANQFQNCVGTPDGHDDVAVIDAAISHEWILTASAATSNYDLSVHPGPVLDNLSYVNMGTPCNSVYPKTKYIARNGRIGGDQAVGPTINYWTPGVTGLYQRPNGNKLTAQTAFSRFRIFGTTNPTNTSLPVELVNLKAEPINNEFIKVSWTTASEINNKGFVLQRSSNNSSFDSIGWVTGNGTTTNLNNYSFDDRNVEKGIIYYYRLKQIDTDNTYTFSNTVSAKLTPTNIESVSVFPNPSDANATIQILSSVNELYNLEVFNDIGQNMYTNKIDVKANTTSTINLPSTDWAKGMYFIKVHANIKNQITSLKFIKN